MISCKDISFSYDGKVPTLSGITLDIADGAIRTIHGVVNPDKLGHLGPLADLSRGWQRR